MTHTKKDASCLSESVSIFTKSATQAVCLPGSLTQLIIEFYPVWCVTEPSSQSHCTRRDWCTTSANSTRWSIKGIAGFNKWVATTQRSYSGAESPGLCSWHYIKVIACTLVMFSMMKQNQRSDGQSTFFFCSVGNSSYGTSYPDKSPYWELCLAATWNQSMERSSEELARAFLACWTGTMFVIFTSGWTGLETTGNSWDSSSALFG